VVYTDSSLVNLFLGYDYISELTGAIIYNMNSGNGTIGTSTGNSC